MNDAGNTQYNPLLGLVGSQNLHVLIPGADNVTFAPAINGVPNSTVVGNEPFYLGSLASDITWGNSISNQSLVPDTKPDHVISFAAPTTSNITGWTSAHLHALDPTFGDTTPAARLTHTHEWLRIAGPSRKFYPMNFSWDSALAQFRTFKMRSHRRWTPPVSGIDFWTFVRSEDSWLVYMAWTTATGNVSVTLPDYLADLTATAVRAFRGSLVSTDTTNKTLQINTATNHGHMIVRLV
jgi:hypothetical protein